MSSNGSVAQSVEQRTENPCVGGSIPSRATIGDFVQNSIRSIREKNLVESFNFGAWVCGDFVASAKSEK